MISREILNIYFTGDKCIKDNTVKIINENVCLIFSYENTKIHLHEVSKCRMSGTENIELLINFAVNNDFKEIHLEDQSYLSVQLNDDNVSIDLASLNILACGMSWYNRLGFKQKNYDADILRWKRLRQMTLWDIQDEILKLDQDDFNGKGWFEDAFYLLQIPPAENQLLLDTIIEETPEMMTIPIGKMASLIYSNIKLYCYTDNHMLRCHCAYIAIIGCLLDYDRSGLVMKLN